MSHEALVGNLNLHRGFLPLSIFRTAGQEVADDELIQALVVALVGRKGKGQRVENEEVFCRRRKTGEKQIRFSETDVKITLLFPTSSKEFGTRSLDIFPLSNETWNLP